MQAIGEQTVTQTVTIEKSVDRCNCLPVFSQPASFLLQSNGVAQVLFGDFRDMLIHAQT